MREYNNEQSKLIGALIGLCRSLDNSNTTKEAYDILVESLPFIKSEDMQAVAQQMKKVHAAKHMAVPDCSVCSAPCGRTSDYGLQELDHLDVRLKELKFEILDELYECSKYLKTQDISADTVQQMRMILMKGLFSVGYDYFSEEELVEIKDRIRENYK